MSGNGNPVQAGNRITAAMLNMAIPLSVYKATSQSSGASNTTLFNDADLVVQLVANAVYRWESDLWYTGANSPGDLQLQWAAPAGASGGWSGEWINVSNAFTIVKQQPYGSSGNVSLGAISGDEPARMWGVLATGGTTGSLQLQWAQNTSSSTATQVLAYSNLMAWRIA